MASGNDLLKVAAQHIGEAYELGVLVPGIQYSQSATPSSSRRRCW
jgi:hypothetical protein